MCFVCACLCVCVCFVIPFVCVCVCFVCVCVCVSVCVHVSHHNSIFFCILLMYVYDMHTSRVSFEVSYATYHIA